MKVRIVAGLGVLACVLALAPTAAACSCDVGDPRELLTQVDGAFVGTVTEEATPERKPTEEDPHVPMFLTFAVERAVKGELGETVRVQSGQTNSSSCELVLSEGERVGLVLERYKGDWTAGACSLVDPDELIRAGHPPPTPDGVGPPAFLATTNGEHSVVTLDPSGRLLRYGDGKDSVSFDLCPGSEWVAEIDEVFGFVDDRPYIAAARRHVESLAVEDEKRLVQLELPEPDEPFGVAAISCRDRTASDVYLFAEHPGYDDDLILRVKDGAITQRWKGQAAGVAFADGRDVAYLARGREGNERDIVELNLASGEERVVGTVGGRVFALSVQPNGSLVAGMYGTGEVRLPNRTFTANLFIVDPGTGQPKTVEVGDGGWATWISRDRIAYSGWEQGLDIYDDDLKKVASKPGWKGVPTSADGYVYGAWDDAVHYSSMDGPIETLTEMNLTLGSLTVVSPPHPVTAPAAAQPLTKATGLHPVGWAAIGALAVGSIGGLVLVVRRRSPPS